ncbi:hypothetical protein [Luteimonas sp. R10]|uniref:hypothetical protein n=1 Tax=Luteimonas sp. R10 TaxID=3108176 RepID=UPI00308AA601|nr:DUF4123 domain-containing protein [Luteimonas sp. R10]
MHTDLIRTLSEKLQADSSCSPCLLVDPMLREPFSKDWLADIDAEVVPVPVRHPSLKEDQRPLLIRIRPRDTPLLEASVNMAIMEQENPDAEQGGGFSIGGWLLSTGRIDGLAVRMAACMQTAAPVRAGRRLVRWADRRVLEWMWPVLTQDQRTDLLGTVTDWFAIDRCERLVTYGKTGTGVAGTLKLSSSQWEHAQNCHVVQDLLRGWRRFRRALPMDYLRQCADAVQSIRKMGVDGRQDQVLLGAYVLQVHPRLVEHPRFIAAVRRAAAEGVPLMGLLAEIPDPEGWEMMRADLDRQAGAPVTLNQNQENNCHG